MPLLAVTVLGHDRPGIIADVTGVLADLGGNLEDSSMTRLRGHFAMTLVVRTQVPAPVVQAELTPAVPDLVVAVRDLPDEPVVDLQRALAGVASGLGVEATLRPAEADVL